MSRPANTASLVMQDEDGIYVLIGTRKFRPGAVKGYDGYPMDDGGIKLRSVARVSPNYGKNLIQVVTPKGQRVWSSLVMDDPRRF